MRKKIKIAILSLTSCAGCQVEVLNLGEKIGKIGELFQIVNFPLIEDRRDYPKYDVLFIEGSPAKKEEIKKLKKLRKKTKILVALGACACIGGIPEMKNYKNRYEIMRKVYKRPEGIDNIEIKPLKEIVKVDFEIPGCPPRKEEILRFLIDTFFSKKFKIPQFPVCFECQIRQYECLLQKGKVCLGPIILGGCEAICLKNKIPCHGCRGFLKEPFLKNYLEVLKKYGIEEKEFWLALEKFGLKDEAKKIYEKEKNKD